MTDNTRDVVRNQLLLEAIREWVNHGLYRLGAPASEAKHAAGWHDSTDHLMHKISHAYVKDIDGYRPKTT